MTDSRNGDPRPVLEQADATIMRNADFESGLYWVPAYRVPSLQTKIKRLSTRAAKLGCEPVSLETVRVHHVRESSLVEHDAVTSALIAVDGVAPPDSYIEVVREYHVVRAHGSAPSLNGWTFIATIADAGEAGNLLRIVPGETVPPSYRSTPKWCDHCRVERRRRDTYIVRNASGEHKQVGSDCLRDFLGHQSPEALARFAALLADFEASLRDDPSFDDGSGHDAERAPLDRFLAQVSALIRKDGWRSRTTAREYGGSATADIAMIDYFDRKGEWRKHYSIAEADREHALQAVEWAEALVDRDDLDDYLWNVRVVAAGGSVDMRTAGIAASIIIAYDKATEREIQRRSYRASVLNEHFGQEKQRYDLVLTVERVKFIESAYQDSSIALHTMRDADGRVFVWFASTTELEVGATYKVKGTVKRHDEWEGIKRTTLTRCKAERVPGDGEAA